FTTDAAVPGELLQRALREAVGDSLNRITVDGDTSTNDCAVILASGARPGAAVAEGGTFNAFRRGLVEASHRLAEMLVRDAWVAEGGHAREDEEEEAAQAMQEDPVRFRIRLGEGGATGWIWTSDFSSGYVDINAHYRS